MEVNEAPEKIYRTTTYLNNIGGQTMWKRQPVERAKNIEYIRTDAIIEKVLDYIENNIYDHYDGDNEYGICGGYVKKEEFIKNFKNYMKGK